MGMWPGWLNASIAVLNKIPVVGKYVPLLDSLATVVSGILDAPDMVIQSYNDLKTKYGEKFMNVAKTELDRLIDLLKGKNINVQVPQITVPDIGNSQPEVVEKVPEVRSEQGVVTEGTNIHPKGMRIISYTDRKEKEKII